MPAGRVEDHKQVDLSLFFFPLFSLSFSPLDFFFCTHGMDGQDGCNARSVGFAFPCFLLPPLFLLFFFVIFLYLARLFRFVCLAFCRLSSLSAVIF